MNNELEIVEEFNCSRLKSLTIELIVRKRN